MACGGRYETLRDWLIISSYASCCVLATGPLRHGVVGSKDAVPGQSTQRGTNERPPGQPWRSAYHRWPVRTLSVHSHIRPIQHQCYSASIHAPVARLNNTPHEALQCVSVHGIKAVLRLAVNIQHPDNDVIVGTATRPCTHEVLGPFATERCLMRL